MMPPTSGRGIRLPNVLTLELFPSLEAAESDWRRLAVHDANLFSTWEWSATWWRHCGHGRPLRIFGCRHPDGQIVGILPFYLSRTLPFRVLRLIGHGPSDVLGPLCAPENRWDVVDAMRRLTENHGPRGWDLVISECLPGTEPWSELIGGRTIHRIAFPIVSIHGRSWDEFLGSHSRDFRHKLERRQRKLARDHNVRFRMTEDPAGLPSDFDALLRLHRARWGAEATGAFAGALEAFHRDFATQALERGWLRLWLAEVDGVAVAAKYVFRYGNVDWAYQGGRDPAWDAYRVGTLMSAHVIRDAFNAGVEEFRMLRGDEAYKQSFATHDPGVQTVVAPRTSVGRAALAVARAAAGSSWARRLIAGLAG